MQIQLSTQSFRIYYGDNFGEWLSYVINAAGEYSVNFILAWYDDFCIVVMDKMPRKVWHDLLFDFFSEACSDDEDEEDEEYEESEETKS